MSTKISNKRIVNLFSNDELKHCLNYCANKSGYKECKQCLLNSDEIDVNSYCCIDYLMIEAAKRLNVFQVSRKIETGDNNGK